MYENLSEKYIRKLLNKIVKQNHLCWALDEETGDLDIPSVSLASVCMLVDEAMGRRKPPMKN